MCKHKPIPLYPSPLKIAPDKASLYFRSTRSANTHYAICEYCGAIGAQFAAGVSWHTFPAQYIKDEIKAALDVWRAVGMEAPKELKDLT